MAMIHSQKAQPLNCPCQNCVLAIPTSSRAAPASPMPIYIHLRRGGNCGQAGGRCETVAKMTPAMTKRMSESRGMPPCVSQRWPMAARRRARRR